MKEISVIQLTLPNGDLVLQRRDNNTEISSPGLLGFFGGQVEDGESPEYAMERELLEETSLKVSELHIVHITSIKLADPKNPNFFRLKVHFFKTNIDSDNFAVYEGERAETYSLPMLKKRNDLAPTARYLVDHFAG